MSDPSHHRAENYYLVSAVQELINVMLSVLAELKLQTTELRKANQ